MTLITKISTLVLTLLLTSLTFAADNAPAPATILKVENTTAQDLRLTFGNKELVKAGKTATTNVTNDELSKLQQNQEETRYIIILLTDPNGTKRLKVSPSPKSLASAANGGICAPNACQPCDLFETNDGHTCNDGYWHPFCLAGSC